MRTSRWGLVTSVTAAAVLVAWSVATLNARAGDRQSEERFREVTLTGRVVDLHSFMTGKMASSDPVQCTADCIRNGVPPALETDGGLVILGEGTRGATKTLLPLAYQEVEVRGKLFQKGDIRYLDIAAARPVHPGDEEPDMDWPDEPEDED